MTSSRRDTWASGELYEPYVGRWSRLVGREFLAWLAVRPDSRWLDVGCGTGALTQMILECAAACNVVGIDPSADYITYARDHARDNRARFQVADSQSLPFDAASFEAVASGLVLNFVPMEPDGSIRLIARAWAVRGTV